MTGRAWCRCRVDGTDCIAVSGHGSPADCDGLFEADVVVDTALTNGLEVGPDGLIFRIPTALSRTLAFGLQQGKPITTTTDDDFLPYGHAEWSTAFMLRFDQVSFDTSGIWDGQEAVIPRAGLWDFVLECDGGVEAFTGATSLIALVLNKTSTIAQEGQQRFDGGRLVISTQIELELDDSILPIISGITPGGVFALPDAGAKFSGVWVGE